MLRTDNHSPLMYVECDIPDGMTLIEWRREKVAAERHARAEAREARTAERTAALKRLLPRLAPPKPKPRPSFRPRFA